MTKKIMLIAAMSQNIPRLSDYEYVGIDKGALTAIRAQLPLICAIGDFDSVTETVMMKSFYTAVWADESIIRQQTCIF